MGESPWWDVKPEIVILIRDNFSGGLAREPEMALAYDMGAGARLDRDRGDTRGASLT